MCVCVFARVYVCLCVRVYAAGQSLCLMQLPRAKGRGEGVVSGGYGGGRGSGCAISSHPMLSGVQNGMCGQWCSKDPVRICTLPLISYLSRGETSPICMAITSQLAQHPAHRSGGPLGNEEDAY